MPVSADRKSAGADAGSKDPNKKERQAAVAKERICKAVVACLDAYGYSETSIKRIQDAAEVSRGALTHHFPTKEDLIVETTARLLRPVLEPDRPKRQARRRQSSSLEAEFLWTWTRLVDTPEGRALTEILNAARTDKALQYRISQRFKDWNQDLNTAALSVFEATGGDADARALWTICRVFIRGLIVQKQFEEGPKAVEDLLKRFADLMAPHLQPRQQGRTTEHDQPV